MANIINGYVKRLALLSVFTFCGVQYTYSQTNKIMTPDLRGCWKNVQKADQQNGLDRFCFEDGGNVDAVFIVAGPALDVVSTTWVLKNNTLSIEDKICKFKYAVMDEFTLSNCSYQGVYRRAE